MAEQLLTDGTVNEQQLKSLPLKKAREDIGISLLHNSSLHAYFGYSYITIVITFCSGYARSLLVLWGI